MHTFRSRSWIAILFIFISLVTIIPIQAQEQPQPPYPYSSVITGIEWAPTESIVYKAEGSDNWPLTWANDGHMYTTFGDGWGFEPKVPQKLSLGFVRIEGEPENFTGVNIRSSDEQMGDGRSGRKASGILSLDGVLYMLVRNANHQGKQSILAWSNDHAQNWTWADWRWEEFGYSVFLNFGQDYTGVPNSLQGYVYFYSPDTPDAYNETDHVILGRAPVDQITQEDAYEFFAGVDDSGNPIWKDDIRERESVFTFPNGCNRMDVTYNAGLKRYLMTMRSRSQAGGKNHFSIYDAPQPWGPWTTVYYAETWEIRGREIPLSTSNQHWGEVAHIPSKWISEDGTEFHLVFAGNDSFAVRKATLTVNLPSTVNNNSKLK